MKIALNLLGMNPAQGGMYQYAVTFTRHLLGCDETNRYVLFYDYDGLLDNKFNLVRTTPVRVVEQMHLGFALFGRSVWTPRWATAQRILRRLLSELPVAAPVLQGDYSLFARHGATLLIQPSHVSADALLSGLPYLIAIHDAPYQWTESHRKTRSPKFLAWYDALIKALARQAMAVFVDSPSGAEAMIKGYGVAADRIRIMPFRPPDYLAGPIGTEQAKDAADRLRLPESYLFYPSKFHAHKNHLGLIDALSVLKSQHGIAPPLVLVGSSSNDDTYARVMARIDDAGLRGQVHCLGYVSDEDMKALYTRAAALVFPTLMGPTAIPVLEAFAVGCPVICSNVEGFSEQVGDAGILVDPHSPAEMAHAIYTIVGDDMLRNELASKGKRRLQELTAVDYGREIHTVVQELADRVGGGA